MLQEPDDDNNITLIEILYGMVSEELLREYVAINNALCRAEITMQLDALSYLDATILAAEIDPLAIPLEVDDLLRTTSYTALLNCGVKCDEDINITDLTLLLETVLEFDVSETPQTLIDRINACGDADEAFWEVLSFLTTTDVSKWMDAGVSVLDGVIHRILQLAQDEVSSKDNSSTLDNQAVYALNEKLLALRDGHTILQDIDMLESTPSLEHLYILHVNSLIDAPMEDAVEGLFALSRLCSDNMSTVNDGVNLLLDDLYPEPAVRAAAERYRHEVEGKYRLLSGG